MTQTGNVNNPFTYAGYQYDNESGLYYLNARYYDPVTARFITEDTYLGDRYDPLSLNLYTYCHNEPIMYVDPSGHTEAQLRDLVAAAGGEVGWNNETRTATATVNGVEKNFKIEDYKVEDGRIIIDSEMFDSMFSNDYVSVSSRVEPQRITATMRYYYGGGHEEITGSAPNNYPKSSYDIKSVAKGNVNNSFNFNSDEYGDIVNEMLMKDMFSNNGKNSAINTIIRDVENNPASFLALKYGEDESSYLDFLNLVNNVVQGSIMTEEINYFRNELNKAPETLDLLLQEKDKWKLLPPDEAIYHMFGEDGEFNLKFVSIDGGNFEAVYDKNGHLVTDPENMGTYNFVGPQDARGHGIFDVLPYYRFNTTAELLGDPIMLNVRAKENKVRYYSNLEAMKEYEKIQQYFSNK